MKVVVICGMSDEKVRARLLPLTEIASIEKIFLIRRSPITMKNVKSFSSPNVFRWSLLFSELYRLIILLILCIKEKPDFLYAIYFVPHGLYAAIFGGIFNIPVIQELIGTDRNLVNRSKYYQKLLKRSKRIGVRGTTSLSQLSDLLGEPEEKFFISVAVNAIDFELFKPSGLEKNFDLVFCGRLDQNKQVNLILGAFYEVYRTNPDVKLLFIGDGPEKVNLQSKTLDLGISQNVIFAGRQKYQDIPELLNQSRIFIMASSFEGLPVAMIEALSCGLPVIVPDVGDISDIARHGYNGLLVIENKVTAYRDAIQTIVSDTAFYEKLRTGALETREKFLRNFSVENASDIWKDILESVD
jgi:glycosyltransferase involved in cell wall biosynthesis